MTEIISDRYVHRKASHRNDIVPAWHAREGQPVRIPQTSIMSHRLDACQYFQSFRARVHGKCDPENTQTKPASFPRMTQCVCLRPLTDTRISSHYKSTPTGCKEYTLNENWHLELSLSLSLSPTIPVPGSANTQILVRFCWYVAFSWFQYSTGTQ